MATNWGLFLCNCRKALALDPQRLVLPIAPSVLSSASDPDDFHEFVSRINSERVDRVLISCCASQAYFNQALAAAAAISPEVHFVNLKESCFAVHSDSQQAHAKATRLLRAAMETAEQQETPPYNPLNVGGRILIAADGPEGKQLAEKLGDVGQPIFVVPPSISVFDSSPSWQINRGRVVEVKGRLGDFTVTVEDAEPSVTPRREIKADQVVIISQRTTEKASVRASTGSARTVAERTFKGLSGHPEVLEGWPEDFPGESQDNAIAFKPRTGLQLLTNPSQDELDRAAQRVRDLVGDFLKPVHVAYSADICAGGTANQESCGICITACPYDAISRDPQNHLRMRVDHMACEGCGACVSACPTTALRFTDPSPQELYRRLAALLTRSPQGTNGERLTLLFHCGEEGRRVLEEAGRRPLPYPGTLLPVEVPCLRYVSDANMLAAFGLGAAGVGLLGCEKCPHGERELLHQKIEFCRVTLDAFGLGVERLRLITADEGAEAEAVTSLSRFAESLEATPIHWDGKPMRQWGNREVIAETLRTLVEQTDRQPGRKSLDTSQPFAFAEVRASGCTMCRSCVNVCPTHAFSLDESSQSLQFKHIACVACGLCEKVCPENVITLRHEILFERDGLEYQTVVQDDMVSCVKCGKPYINRRALEAVEARVLSLDSLLDTFSGGRRNILRMCPDCRTVVAMLEVEKGWKP